MKIEVTEVERQAVLLALAELSLRRPGWDYMLNDIACKMDNVSPGGRAVMYDSFRGLDTAASIGENQKP
jgi:hypothetical protein